MEKGSFSDIGLDKQDNHINSLTGGWKSWNSYFAMKDLLDISLFIIQPVSNG